MNLPRDNRGINSSPSQPQATPANSNLPHPSDQQPVPKKGPVVEPKQLAYGPQNPPPTTQNYPIEATPVTNPQTQKAGAQAPIDEVRPVEGQGSKSKHPDQSTAKETAPARSNIVAPINSQPNHQKPLPDTQPTAHKDPIRIDSPNTPPNITSTPQHNISLQKDAPSAQLNPTNSPMAFDSRNPPVQSLGSDPRAISPSKPTTSDHMGQKPPVAQDSPPHQTSSKTKPPSNTTPNTQTNQPPFTEKQPAAPQLGAKIASPLKVDPKLASVQGEQRKSEPLAIDPSQLSDPIFEEDSTLQLELESGEKKDKLLKKLKADARKVPGNENRDSLSLEKDMIRYSNHSRQTPRDIPDDISRDKDPRGKPLADPKDEYNPILNRPSIDSIGNSPLKPPSTPHRPKQESQIWQEFSHARNQDQSQNKSIDNESRVTPKHPSGSQDPKEAIRSPADHKKPAHAAAGQDRPQIGGELPKKYTKLENPSSRKQSDMEETPKELLQGNPQADKKPDYITGTAQPKVSNNTPKPEIREKPKQPEGEYSQAKPVLPAEEQVSKTNIPPSKKDATDASKKPDRIADPLQSDKSNNKQGEAIPQKDNANPSRENPAPILKTETKMPPQLVPRNNFEPTMQQTGLPNIADAPKIGSQPNQPSLSSPNPAISKSPSEAPPQRQKPDPETQSPNKLSEGDKKVSLQGPGKASNRPVSESPGPKKGSGKAESKLPQATPMQPQVPKNLKPDNIHSASSIQITPNDLEQQKNDPDSQMDEKPGHQRYQRKKRNQPENKINNKSLYGISDDLFEFNSDGDFDNEYLKKKRQQLLK